jgi:hypothetical protein
MQMWKVVEFKAFAYIVYIRERYYFSLVSTFEKAIKNVEVTIDIQKVTKLKFEKTSDNRCGSPIQLSYLI